MTCPFWPNVKKIIDARNMSQADLGRLAGMTKQTINSGTSRKLAPRIDTAFRVSQALNVSLDALMGAGEPEAEFLAGDERRLVDGYRDLDNDGRQAALNLVAALHKQFPLVRNN
jgi:transcriptional regulator with XRE-family HTH domain